MKEEKKRENLHKLWEKWVTQDWNQDNYLIGGGLGFDRFESARHEDAKADPGKRTLGQVTQMFMRATGEERKYVKGLIQWQYPLLEWHHAGKLPKAYGGGMKKTYYLNAREITQLAKHWESIDDEYYAEVAAEEQREKEERLLAQDAGKFLRKWAKYFFRETEKPRWSVDVEEEMNGKYGWFRSETKSYNLPTYYSGWAFRSRKKYLEYVERFGSI